MLLNENKKINWVNGSFPSVPYANLVRQAVVRDWLATYSSPSTRRLYLYGLGYLMQYAGISSAKELLELDLSEAKRLVLAAAHSKANEGNPAMGQSIIVAAKSFFSFYDKELRIKRTETIKRPPKKVLIQYVPTAQEVYRIADHANNLRDRAVILCLWQSGVRANCLCKWTWSLVEPYLYRAEETLEQLGSDVFKIKNGIIVPVPLKITWQMDSKLKGYGLGYYYTFLGYEAAKALKDYLDWRLANGWKPQPNSLLFVPGEVGNPRRGRGKSWNYKVWKNKEFTVWHIWEIIKRAVKNAGFNPETIWTHVLRKAFRKT